MVKYDRNEPYNDLPLLPPSTDLLDKEVLVALVQAARSLAELNRNTLRLPNPGMLINTISLQEAKSSSAIENIFTTEDELYKAISDTLKEGQANPNTKEVLRYREALWTGFQNIRSKNAIDLNVVISIYRQIKDSTQGIRPPQSEIVIRRGDSELRSGEVVYTPPRGKVVLEERMNNLVDYLNETDKDIDPLIKMAIAHYQFEAIHPFTDGNGRTGRVLNLLYLVHQGLLSHPVLYLSKYIIENKDEYYHHLSAITQRQSWKPWLIYMLKGVEQTSRYTNQLIDDIVSQMEATLLHGKKELKWYSKEINEALFNQPYIKMSVVGNITQKTSRTTLTKYMNELCEIGILSPRQDGKDVFYMNNDLLRILQP
jgi:Fic family protein